MIRQIRYFQAVVRNNSFSEAAEECHISQSAISQQIQALERELGFELLERKNRKFILTPAGEYFYKKSLVLNDQRRAFSDRYVNLILTVGNAYIEISSRNPIASLPSVTPQELKNVPCILVASREQRKNEQEYYQDVVGFQGGFSLCGKFGGGPPDGDWRAGVHAGGRCEKGRKFWLFHQPYPPV